MKSYALLGLRNLTRRRSRSLLTALGVLLAVGFTVGLLSISEGFMRSIDAMILAQGPELFVMPRGESKMPFPMRGTTLIEETTARLISGIPGVRMAEPVYQTFCVTPGAGIGGRMGGMPNIVAGIPPEGFFVVRPTAKVAPGGRWLKASDRHVVVLGAVMAQNLKKGVGDTVELVADVKMKVVGVLLKDDKPFDYFGYAPLRDLQRMYPGVKGRISYVLVKLDRTDQMQKVAADIRRRYPKFDVQTVSELAEQMRRMMSIARAIHLGVSCFALVIGVLFVACTMIMSVSERIREFAALRVIGASRGFVVRLILYESVTLCLAGGALGCGFGVALSHGINLLIFHFVGDTFLQTLVSVRIFGVGLLIAFLIGAFAAVLPALMILKRNLAESLRYE